MLRIWLYFVPICFAMSSGRVTQCPGKMKMEGRSPVHLIATQWNQPDFAAGPVDYIDGRIVTEMWGRAYFGEECINGTYSNTQYSAIPLLGRRLTYTTNLSQSGCGCNAAMYLVSMRQNPKRSGCFDYYCDANFVCGVNCHEIDIQEANRHAWHSAMHHESDGLGAVAGYGGYGYDHYAWDGQDYGLGGRCINTQHPFQVSAAFPTNNESRLEAMVINLTQSGSPCSLSLSVDSYDADPDFLLLSEALDEGMTPVVSYWKSQDMLWLDGRGPTGMGPCEEDVMDCGFATEFYDFAVEDL